MKIFVVGHKRLSFELAAPYVPIYVGGIQTDDGELNDRTGQSIHSKNPNYCELTAHYWVWKNVFPSLADDEPVGFCHYRRYFDFSNFGPPGARPFDAAATQDGVAKLLDDNHEVIVPTPYSMTKKASRLRRLFSPKGYRAPRSLFEQYCRCHIASDIELALTIPADGCEIDLARHLEGNLFYPANMYIARKSALDLYFKHLFNWLSGVEERISTQGRDVYQARVFGFLAERFASSYMSTRLRFATLPLVLLSDAEL